MITDWERPRGRAGRAGAWLLHEFYEVLPPTVFFAVGFNLVVFSMNLVLAQYSLHVASVLVATTAALVVGKAVLVANTMPFLRRFDTAPLVWPILFKTFVYWVFVFIARLIEAFVRHLVDAGRARGFFYAALEQFSWHRFVFIQLWVLVLFLIYVTASELNALFGDGELLRVLFRHRSSELKLNRRQRIRTLVQLGRLAATHPIEELETQGSKGNRILFAMVSALGRAETVAGQARSGRPAA